MNSFAFCRFIEEEEEKQNKKKTKKKTNKKQQKNKKNRKINTQKNYTDPESTQEPLDHQSSIDAYVEN